MLNFCFLLSFLSSIISDGSFEGSSPLNKNEIISLFISLREVLNNWCADFGYSFTWGIGERSIVFIDLSKGVESAFEEVKDIIVRLIDEPQRLETISSNSVILASKYDWKVLIKDWEKVIEDLFNEK